MSRLNLAKDSAQAPSPGAIPADCAARANASWTWSNPARDDGAMGITPPRAFPWIATIRSGA